MENANHPWISPGFPWSAPDCRPFTGILNTVRFEKDQYINTGDLLAELLQIDR